MEKDIEERLDKIENMLRHIHDHVEKIGNEVWVVREGLPHVLQIVGEVIGDLQKGEESDRIGSISQDLLLQLIDSTDELYSPIDEKDKEKHDKEEEERGRERERIMKNKLE